MAFTSVASTTIVAQTENVYMLSYWTLTILEILASIGAAAIVFLTVALIAYGVQRRRERHA